MCAYLGCVGFTYRSSESIFGSEMFRSVSPARELGCTWTITTEQTANICEFPTLYRMCEVILHVWIRRENKKKKPRWNTLLNNLKPGIYCM